MTTKIRSSPFRHLNGTGEQLRNTYGDLRIGSISGESTVIKGNSTFFAIPWANTGSIAVVPLSRYGTVPEDTPTFTYFNDEMYQTQINEFNFSPHDDKMIGSAGNDGGFAIWKIPTDEGLTEEITTPEIRVQASDKRLLNFEWHPLAEGIVIVGAGNKVVSFHDLQQGGAEQFTLPQVHKGLVTGIDWNYEGSLMATCCKDKKLRIFDPRNTEVVAEVANHKSPKSAHLKWMNNDMIYTAGFSGGSAREIAVYDPRNMEDRVHTLSLNPSSSTMFVYGDYDTKLIFIAGKGDGTIDYFDTADTEPYIHTLTNYKAKTPQNGLCMLPKSCCNVNKCEVARFLKLSGTRAEPIRFEVPRAQQGFFQSDLFPDTWDRNSCVSSADWFDGQNGERNLISLEPVDD
eukprot:TRINITY_DN13164_c0_g1_i1.p1 TRINITY_DN13164_c0_g1~~TRINITY_DN13164_c0_g1_i1.p1  ORF type:complete len:401 (-),score=155.46 TRINITY_DN13164_c0_g1_i1:132-1334(-)